MYSLADGLFLAACALQLIWAYRLKQLGLLSRYRTLFIYLSTTGLLSLGAFVLSPYQGELGNLYGWYWVICQPLGCILLFCLVMEVGTRLVGGYPGLERLGQIMIYGVVDHHHGVAGPGMRRHDSIQIMTQTACRGQRRRSERVNVGGMPHRRT